MEMSAEATAKVIENLLKHGKFNIVTRNAMENAVFHLNKQAELVRCKDCEFYEEMGHFCKYNGLYKKNSWHQYGYSCNDDWFCADGVAKDINVLGKKGR